MMANTDARIVLTIDYEPNLEHYPPHIKTKAEAMWFDVRQVLNGRTANGSRARRSAVHAGTHCGPAGCWSAPSRARAGGI
jgi:hypothetical protein